MDFSIKISDSASRRHKDPNGFLIIKDNPIAKAGVFDYLLYEVDNSYDKDSAQGNEVVRVCRTFDNLVLNKDMFANKPIKLNHVWVGEDAMQADGAIGSIITSSEPYLIADLIIYNPELIQKIENNEIIELSPAYDANILEESGEYQGEPFEYKQELKNVNHLAVVENGRSGSDLRIKDTGENMKLNAFKKALLKFMDAEAEKCEKVEDADKRDLIRQVMAIAGKPNEDFEGGEDEKIDAITKILENLAYDPSETSETDDEEPEVEVNIEKDDEEDKKEEIEDEDSEGDAEFLIKKIAELIDNKLSEFENKLTRTQDAKAKAYAEVSSVVGGFNSETMTANDIYKYGYKLISNRTLDAGIDARSAFLIKAENKNQSVKLSDSKVEEKLSEKYSDMFKNFK